MRSTHKLILVPSFAFLLCGVLAPLGCSSSTTPTDDKGSSSSGGSGSSGANASNASNGSGGSGSGGSKSLVNCSASGTLSGADGNGNPITASISNACALFVSTAGSSAATPYAFTLKAYTTAEKDEGLLAFTAPSGATDGLLTVALQVPGPVGSTFTLPTAPITQSQICGGVSLSFSGSGTNYDFACGGVVSGCTSETPGSVGVISLDITSVSLLAGDPAIQGGAVYTVHGTLSGDVYLAGCTSCLPKSNDAIGFNITF